MKQQQFSLRSRLNSFGFAFNGLAAFFRQEPNAWLHLIATLTVFIAAWYFNLSFYEVIALIIVTGSVWVAEIFNTAIERIMDFISNGKEPGYQIYQRPRGLRRFIIRHHGHGYRRFYFYS